MTLLNGLLKLMLLNPLVDMGTDGNGFSYKKYANGEAEWRKTITFTAPEWSGDRPLYYCGVSIFEIPESVKEHGTLRFILIDSSGASVLVSSVRDWGTQLRIDLVRHYGGNDAIEITGELIVNGKWK